MTQLQLALPVGARRWTLYNLSFIILVIKARLTFSFNLESGKAEYGKLDESCYPITKYESVRAHVIDIEKERLPRFHTESRDLMPPAEIALPTSHVYRARSHAEHVAIPQVQEWLMNEDECPTEWEELLRIRRQNPNYSNGATPLNVN